MNLAGVASVPNTLCLMNSKAFLFCRQNSGIVFCITSKMRSINYLEIFNLLQCSAIWTNLLLLLLWKCRILRVNIRHGRIILASLKNSLSLSASVQYRPLLQVPPSHRKAQSHSNSKETFPLKLHPLQELPQCSDHSGIHLRNQRLNPEWIVRGYQWISDPHVCIMLYQRSSHFCLLQQRMVNMQIHWKFQIFELFILHTQVARSGGKTRLFEKSLFNFSFIIHSQWPSSDNHLPLKIGEATERAKAIREKSSNWSVQYYGKRRKFRRCFQAAASYSESDCIHLHWRDGCSGIFPGGNNHFYRFASTSNINVWSQSGKSWMRIYLAGGKFFGFWIRTSRFGWTQSSQCGKGSKNYCKTIFIKVNQIFCKCSTL